MMEHGIRQLLSESARQALETMFFCASEETVADASHPLGELIASSLQFSGSPPGRFTALVPVNVAGSLAADFFAAEDPGTLDSRQVEEVVGELSNIICGNVLSELETHARFEISTPQPVRIAADDSAPDLADLAPVVCRLELPGGAIVLYLAFEGANSV